jgi:dihydrolipoamide dehydrogenase
MTYDFAIVGGGPGGYTAALRAATLGAKVALIEKEHLGGVCLNWGCIPTKALLKSSKLCETMQKSSLYGINCQGVSPDIPAMVARKDKVVSQIRGGLTKLFSQRKIELFDGEGSLASPNQVKVATPDGERVIEAKNIILATGANIIDLPGLETDGELVLDIKQALKLARIPEHMVVVGAGVVGCEMAQYFSGLGSKVSLVELLKRPLGGMLDNDIEKLVLRGFKKRKYKMHFGDSVTGLDKQEGQVTVALNSGKELKADAVLVAVGMKPCSDELGLNPLGVEMTERCHIKVDQHARTSLGNVYAVGDVTGIQPLAHFAAHMGLVAVRHAMGDESAVIDTDAVPKAVFIDPELAWVGLTEMEAKERHGEVITGQFMMRGLGRATAENQLDGLIKLVARAQDKVVVGAHIHGCQADALIGEATLAMAKGLTIHDIAQTIHAHPTYGEGLMECAEAALGLPIHGV